jgi:hypothetical protein
MPSTATATISRIFGKYKNQEWQELDHTNPDSDYTLPEQQAHLEGEWKVAMGNAWLFKWQDD